MQRRAILVFAIAFASIGSPSAPATACTPGEGSCFPTPSECATGQYNGVWADPTTRPLFPSAVCVSADGHTIIYAGGDPTVCGTIIIADQTAYDDAPDGDPNACVPSQDEVSSSGYFTVRDGTALRYSLTRPSASGRFPTALIYTTYSPGSATGLMRQPLLDAGYAVLAVNVRGTGCSGGLWDLWLPTTDGYDAVEWAASQSWSTGDVGMFGYSSPGISQIVAASSRPPALRAIAPLDVTTDIYREFAYPGGILNLAAAAWEGARLGTGASGMVDAIGEGGTECPSNVAARPVPNDGRVSLEGLQHPWLDDWWRDRTPAAMAHDIDVPVLTCQAWQDDSVGSRAGGVDGGSWLDELDPTETWAIYTNGYHGACAWSDDFTDLLISFFDRYVKGDDNGFEAQPRVQIWHESSDWYETDPSWVTTSPSLPVVDPVAFYFRDDGVLDRMPPGQNEPDASASYAPHIPASPMDAGDTYEDSHGWAVPPIPGSYAAWTSAVLDEDLEVFGPGSVDIWLSSTAEDTDVQVTLTEIRPDGQEMYLQRSRLRASHRALDPIHSTELQPVQTHREADSQLLSPLEPTPMRIELLPLGHVFRAGSAIRISIEGLSLLTGDYGFVSSSAPAVNTVHHGPAMPSRLVLGRIPGGAAQKPLPPCGVSLSTPCRPDPMM